MTRTNVKLALTLALALGALGIVARGWLDRRVAAEGPAPAAGGKAQEAGEWRYLGSWRVGKAPVTWLMFTPGSPLLMANGDADLQFLSLPSGKIAAQWKIDRAVQSVAFSPDGKLVATGDAGGRIVVWSAESGKPTGPGKTPSDRISALTFSPDGSRLFFGTREGVVKFWDLARWPAEAAEPFAPKAGAVDALVFTPDGKRFYTSGDGTVRIWDMATGEKISETTEWDRGKRAVASTPDGRLVAIAGPTQVALLETQTGQIVRTIDFPSAGLRPDKDICTVACLPDGRTLAVGCNPFLSDEPAGVGEVRFFDLTTGKKTGELKLPAGYVVKVAVSSDGSYLAVGAHDGTVHAWQRTSTPVSAPGRAAGPGRLHKFADELASSSRSGEECVEALFLATLARFPTDTERQFAAAHVAKSTQRREALHDVLYQLTNTREFAEHVSQLKSASSKPSR